LRRKQKRTTQQTRKGLTSRPPAAHNVAGGKEEKNTHGGRPTPAPATSPQNKTPHNKRPQFFYSFPLIFYAYSFSRFIFEVSYALSLLFFVSYLSFGLFCL